MYAIVCVCKRGGEREKERKRERERERERERGREGERERERGREETRPREETIPTQGKQTNHRARLKADECVKYRARTAANKALI